VRIAIAGRGARSLVESRPGPLQHPNVGDSTFGRNDHFQEDLPFETRAARRVGVVRGDFSQQSWWLVPAPGTVRPAAGSTAVPGTHSAPRNLPAADPAAATGVRRGSGLLVVRDPLPFRRGRRRDVAPSAAEAGFCHEHELRKVRGRNRGGSRPALGADAIVITSSTARTAPGAEPETSREPPVVWPLRADPFWVGDSKPMPAALGDAVNRP